MNHFLLGILLAFSCMAFGTTVFGTENIYAGIALGAVSIASVLSFMYAYKFNKSEKENTPKGKQV